MPCHLSAADMHANLLRLLLEVGDYHLRHSAESSIRLRLCTPLLLENHVLLRHKLLLAKTWHILPVILKPSTSKKCSALNGSCGFSSFRFPRGLPMYEVSLGLLVEELLLCAIAFIAAASIFPRGNSSRLLMSSLPENLPHKLSRLLHFTR
jgi:hypothetical protein